MTTCSSGVETACSGVDLRGKEVGPQGSNVTILYFRSAIVFSNSTTSEAADNLNYTIRMHQTDSKYGKSCTPSWHL